MALVGLALLAVGCGDAGVRAGTGVVPASRSIPASGSPAGEVPWVDAPVAPSSTTTTTKVPPPAPAPACRAGDLAARAGRSGAAAGNYLQLVVITNVGPATCQLGGHPNTSTTAPTSTTVTPAVPSSEVTLTHLRDGLGVVGTWARSGSNRPHLFLTTDFAHWRDVTPPQVATDAFGDYPFFEDASFLDPDVGWVTTYDPADVNIALYRTEDGGRTWQAEQGTEHSLHAGATTVVQFLSPAVGFRETLEPTGPGASLSTTADGGAHWAPVSDRLPFVDQVVFADATRGVAVTEPGFCSINQDPGGPWLFATADGGRSWQARSLRPPPGLTGASRCVGLPTFSDAAHGVLPVAFDRGGRGFVGFYTTADAGASWDLASTVAAPVAEDNSTGSGFVEYPGVAVAGAGTWWVAGASASGPPPVVKVSTDAGHQWSEVAPTGLPSPVGELQAAGPTLGWALEGPSARLFSTSDGGRSWAPVALGPPG